MTHFFEDFLMYMRDRLSEPLPGEPVQYRMAPQRRRERTMESAGRLNPRQAGVLLVFYPEAGQVMVPLILRPVYEGVHSGQVAFPGGRMEEGDESVVHTALREANEEIGVQREEIRLLGQLSPLYIPPSNFLVTPVLAYAASVPAFRADPFEVAEIIPVPVKALVQETTVKEKQITTWSGLKLTTPYYALNEFTIWGATAMMISELAEILKNWKKAG
ncbi:MAG: CoA pyrophosphatase [Bacteroidia bacterium]